MNNDDVDVQCVSMFERARLIAANDKEKIEHKKWNFARGSFKGSERGRNEAENRQC